MKDTLKFESKISDIVMLLGEAKTQLEDLSLKLEEISVNLASGKWAGEACDKCKDIHTLIIEYATKLKPCCNSAQNACRVLDKELFFFDNGSECVKNVGNW